MRTNAHTDEVNCSHAAMVSHAGLVAYLIEKADHGTC